MYQKLTGTLVYGSGDTDKTVSWSAPHINSEARVLVVDVPNFTAALTVTVYYKSDGGKVMSQTASVPKNAVTPISLNLPFIDGADIRCLLTAAPTGSGGTITVYLYLGVHQFH